jgi:galactokinase
VADPHAVAEQFQHEFAGAPAGVWSAPGRVNLIGEHTDYNGGLALPIALPQRTYAAVRLRDDGRLRLSSAFSEADPVVVSVSDIAPDAPRGWASYPAGTVWALREAGHLLPGAEVHIGSDVPVGAGLSSSAAIECCVAAAVSDLLDLGMLADDDGRAQLAAWCQQGENVVAQAPTGGMDQAISMRAMDAHALLLDARTGEVEQVPFDLAAHGLALLVIDTRTEHALVDGQYAERRKSCEAAAAALAVGTLREVSMEDLEDSLSRLADDITRARVRHVVTEIDRVVQCVAALRAEDFDDVGRLFLASHASLRDDYEVSCRELDLAVDTAMAKGALGARMTGGGFGGSAIAIVRADAVDSISTAVMDAFLSAGLREPHCFAVTAGPAAGRDA